RLLLREPALGIDPSLKRSRTLTAVRAPVSGPPPRRTPLLNERHLLPLSPQIPVALLVPLRAVRCVWPIPCLARLARSRLLTDEGLAALRQRAPFDGSVFLIHREDLSVGQVHERRPTLPLEPCRGERVLGVRGQPGDQFPEHAVPEWGHHSPEAGASFGRLLVGWPSFLGLAKSHAIGLEDVSHALNVAAKVSKKHLMGGTKAPATTKPDAVADARQRPRCSLPF